jgi:integrase
VHETGHRIGSVRRLRWSAIDIDRRMTPWRAENDKIGFAYETPLSDAAVALFGAAKNRRATAVASVTRRRPRAAPVHVTPGHQPGSDHKREIPPSAVTPSGISRLAGWACEELNLGPHAYQACALTT